MTLPHLLVLTDRHACPPPRPLVETVAAAVEGGARAVVLREKDLPPAERVAIGRDLTAVLAPVDGTLIVASDPTVADGLDTPWLHLAAADPLPGPAFRFGRSVHSAGELGQAVTDAAFYVTVSPVFLTESKPGYGPALGVDALAGLVRLAGPLPVYALGGVDPSVAAECRAAGAWGVAAMGGVMRAGDPAEFVRGLLGQPS